MGNAEYMGALLNLVAGKLQGESLEYYRQIWEKFDTDHSGNLSTSEFLQMMTSPEFGMDVHKAESLMAMADVDGNGTIDFNEFVAVMFNPNDLTEDKLETYLTSLFTGLAGEDNQLSRKEFAAVFPEAMSKTLIKAMFDEMDSDGNGKVDLAEFSQFIA